MTTDDGTIDDAQDQETVGLMSQQDSSLIRLTDFRADPHFAGINGRGETVVVIDTGIDLNHLFFGPDANLDGAADRIIYSYDFSGSNDASDTVGHGSNVASVIGSQDATYTGMAPGCNIIALKVFPDFSTSTSNAAIKEALDWVVANRAAYNIVSVNLSLGTVSNNNSPTASPFSSEFANLATNNCIVAVASGNSYSPSEFQSQGVSSPSSDPNAWSIGAVWDRNAGGPYDWSTDAIDYTTGPDLIASFSQRSTTMTTVFAPGGQITGANYDGGTITYSGTSQATPHIAGLVADMQQLAFQVSGHLMSTADLRTTMRASAATIVDSGGHDNVVNSGATYLRVDAEAWGLAILNLLFAGTAGNDVLNGTPANDVINGGAGDDALSGGGGNNALDGGSGNNTASYSRAPGGVSVNLTNGTAANGYGGTDTLRNIQNVTGSAFSDVLIGDSESNWLFGGSGGSDVIDGAGGSDVLIGGAGGSTLFYARGNDAIYGDGAGNMAAYFWRSTGVTVTLPGSGTTTDSLGDTLSGIQDIYGSQGNDTLIGDAGNNVIYGAGGNDLIDGGGGNDTFVGGYGGGNTFRFEQDNEYATISNFHTGAGGDVLSFVGADYYAQVMVFSVGGAPMLLGQSTAGGTSRAVLSGLRMSDLSLYDNIVGVTTINFSTLAGASHLTISLASANTGTPDGLTHIASVYGSLGGGDTITGNQNNNFLMGFGAGNVLDGAGGSDVLIGGAGGSTLFYARGNDAIYGDGAGNMAAYFWRSTGVTVTLPGSGTTTDSLGDTLSGIQDIYGSQGNDTLIGDAGNNVIYGAGGNDLIDGGGGNDTFVGGYGGGNVFYARGSDTILGVGSNNTVTYAWQINPASGVTVILPGSGTATDSLGDKLTDIQNIIGSRGNDTLTGDAGNNILAGNGGYDAYRLGRGGGQDTVVNGLAGNSGPTGKLDLGAGIAANQLWLLRSGSDLQIDIMGTPDHATVAGWYSSPTTQLQQVTTADGFRLDTQLQQLVQAMAGYAGSNASFDPTAAIQAPNDPSLQAALAAAWHH
jgi:Ca2+-binding RTX toxin-like protein